MNKDKYITKAIEDIKSFGMNERSEAFLRLVLETVYTKGKLDQSKEDLLRIKK